MVDTETITRSQTLDVFFSNLDKIKIRWMQARVKTFYVLMLLGSRSTVMETYMKSNLENNLEAKLCGRLQIFFSLLPCQIVSGWICPSFTALLPRIVYLQTQLRERRLLNPHPYMQGLKMLFLLFYSENHKLRHND